MTQILKRSFIELGFYCQKCGHELEAGVAMSPSAYNEARVEIEPCATCEKNRTGNTAMVSGASSYTAIIDTVARGPIKRVRPPKVNLEPTQTAHKRRGRPPKNAPPAEIVKKKRGRPPKIRTEEQ